MFLFIFFSFWFVRYVIIDIFVHIQIRVSAVFLMFFINSWKNREWKSKEILMQEGRSWIRLGNSRFCDELIHK